MRAEEMTAASSLASVLSLLLILCSALGPVGPLDTLLLFADHDTGRPLT